MSLNNVYWEQPPEILGLKDVVKYLQLKDGQKRYLNRRAAFSVRRQARENILKQKEVNGSSFQERAGKRKNKRMLLGIGRMLSAYGSDRAATVTIKHALWSAIAAQHQEGEKIRWTKRKNQQAAGMHFLNSDATERQAEALLEMGFRRRKNGKKIRVSKRWIMSNLTIGKAGAIYRAMTEDQVSMDSWIIDLPKREFLGLSPDEFEQLANDFMNELYKQIKKVGHI